MTARKAFAPRKVAAKRAATGKKKTTPTITKIGKVKPPVGALAKPEINDLLKVHTCINCGQGSIPLEFDTSEDVQDIPEDGVYLGKGVPLDQVKIHCRKCGHMWTLKEEKSPHRLL